MKTYFESVTGYTLCIEKEMSVIPRVGENVFVEAKNFRVVDISFNIDQEYVRVIMREL